MNERILITDDEKEIAELIELYLKNEGFEVIKAYDGTTAMKYISEEAVSLAILDIMLPDTDGFTLCRKIRQSFTFPIIILTAKSEDIDKITGLTIGADDYVTKPFNPLELTARVKTLLRRCTLYDKNGNSSCEINIGGLTVCKDSRKCTLNGKSLSLTPTEFDILLYLCEKQGKVVSSEELFESVWKEKYYDSNNTVMAHIARLRDKMGEVPRKPKYIRTVWGVGYTIDAQ